MKFNEYGYLEPGFHDFSIKEIKENFVYEFANSLTRNNILEGYINFLDTLIGCGIERVECWIDGSFSTSKENPNDIDMVLLVDKDILDNIPLDKRNIINELLTPRIARIKYKCDAYLLVKVAETHLDYNSYINSRSYWRGFFCFDRKEIPKGIIRTSIVKEVG